MTRARVKVIDVAMNLILMNLLFPAIIPFIFVIYFPHFRPQQLYIIRVGDARGGGAQVLFQNTVSYILSGTSNPHARGSLS